MGPVKREDGRQLFSYMQVWIEQASSEIKGTGCMHACMRTEPEGRAGELEGLVRDYLPSWLAELRCGAVRCGAVGWKMTGRHCSGVWRGAPDALRERICGARCESCSARMYRSLSGWLAVWSVGGCGYHRVFYTEDGAGFECLTSQTSAMTANKHVGVM